MCGDETWLIGLSAGARYDTLLFKRLDAFCSWYNTTTLQYIYIYIYIYMCVCVYVCVLYRERDWEENISFSRFIPLSHTLTHIHKHIKAHEWALSVMVIVSGNGISDPGSDSEQSCLHFTSS